MKTGSFLGTCAEASDHSTYVGMQRAAERLQVKDVMTQHVVTICPTDTIQTAAELMSEHHVSCLPVLDHGRFEGILTQRDVLAGSAGSEGGASSATAAQRARPDVPTISPETGVLEAGRIMEAQSTKWLEAGRIMEAQSTKWLPVLAAGQLEGIVTQADIIGAITSLVKVVEVGTVMNTDLTTVDAATTVREATRTMTDQGISCVVAVHGGKMVGILTEKDILRRVCAADKDPDQVLVADVMPRRRRHVVPCHDRPALLLPLHRPPHDGPHAHSSSPGHGRGSSRWDHHANGHPQNSEGNTLSARNTVAPVPERPPAFFPDITGSEPTMRTSDARK